MNTVSQSRHISRKVTYPAMTKWQEQGGRVYCLQFSVIVWGRKEVEI